MERENKNQKPKPSEELSSQELQIRIINLEKILTSSIPPSTKARILSRKKTLQLILSRKTNQIN